MAPDKFMAHGPKNSPIVAMMPTIPPAPSWAIPSKLREKSAGHAADGSAPGAVQLQGMVLVLVLVLLMLLVLLVLLVLLLLLSLL